jgi:hypothetical protein
MSDLTAASSADDDDALDDGRGDDARVERTTPPADAPRNMDARHARLEGRIGNDDGIGGRRRSNATISSSRWGWRDVVVVVVVDDDECASALEATMAIPRRRCVEDVVVGGDVATNAETDAGEIETMTRNAAAVETETARARIDVRNDGAGRIVIVIVIVRKWRERGETATCGTSGHDFGGNSRG